MHHSDKFCPVSDACPAVCCDFDGAGVLNITILRAKVRDACQ